MTKLRTIERHGAVCAVVESDRIVMTDLQSALDLLIRAKYEAGTNLVAIGWELIAADFFDLSTGLAGEILQKWVDYGGRIAIYGDFSPYAGRALDAFMRESNRGGKVSFAATCDEAVDRLARQGGVSD